MSNPATHSTGALAPGSRLMDLLIARIKDAHRSVADRPASKAGRPRRRSTDTDVLALRRVFLDLGDAYRSYRRRTGEPVSPEVRDAALRFRRELDLTSLILVAASLERLEGGLVS